jgi:hypothetical protein
VLARHPVLAAVSRLQLEAREEIIAVDAPPYIGGQSNPNDLELRRLADGVAYRFIYAREALASPEHMAALRRCTKAGEQARFLPDVTLKFFVVDRTTALMPVSYKAYGRAPHPSTRSTRSAARPPGTANCRH